MKPRHPIYIPTKSRWATPYTIRALERIGVSFNVVVEPQEAELYAPVVGDQKLVILPHQGQGLVATRNWIWDHARDSGAERFWTFDDNIRDFYRLTGNLKYRCTSGAFLYAIEDFVARYENVPVAGMHYEMFVPRKERHAPFILNTRVYSNMLILTNATDRMGRPYRNEGFYNDDTDLCLRILKDGQCTMLFNAFLVDKLPTMTVKGGMTPSYEGDGRWKMADELRRKHPDVVKITRKWGRWQHQVDYRPFKTNRLIKKPGLEIPAGPNEYGMKLVTVAGAPERSRGS